MDKLLALLGCFPIRSTSKPHLNDEKPGYLKPSSGSYGYTLISEKNPRTMTMATQQAATAILTLLQTAEKRGPTLDSAIQDIVVQAGGWYERLAIAVLNVLWNVLKEGSPVGEAMRDAYEKASDAAAGIADFAREHPLYAAAMCAVIALGILMILAPCVIEALGFGVLGPVEGM